MNIEAVEIRPFRLRLRRPLRTAHAVLRQRAGLLLVLRGADGQLGLGEATPLPDFGTENLSQAQAALHRSEPALLAPGPATPEARLALVELRVSALGPCARAALDSALCDLAARRAGQTLAEWLASSDLDAEREGPLARGDVEVSALLTGETPEELAAEAAVAVQRGFRTLKLKIGDPDAGRDRERVRAARAGAGPGVRIRADANEAWTEREARAHLDALATFDLEYVEQPVPRAEVEALARLRQRGGVPVAADEAANAWDGARRVLDAGAADVLVLKPAALGGIRRARELALRAVAAGIDVALTSLLDGAISVWGTAQLAASLPKPPRACGLATSALLVEDVAAPPVIEKGHITLPLAPGLGLGVELGLEPNP